MNNKQMIIYVLGVILLLTTCLSFTFIHRYTQQVPPAPTEIKHVDWSRNATIYEVNIRQYSKEGTFKAFEKDLPRLQKLGIDILWIMPINPIGEKGRKGPLGSYYAVKDYKAVNPEFGTMDDFKHLVKASHLLGMKLIIDWVPNHTALDNALLVTHPEYYLKDSTGKFVSPFDWTDVVRLDYRNPAMRQYMIETLQWWLKETDLDGFRCDVAHMIPTDFWNQLRPELEKVKPVFMLAEADIPEQHQKGFDMSYDWKFHHIMNQIAQGKKSATAVFKHFAKMDSIYPGDSYLMEFTSNHDENSWSGTEYERLGKGSQTFAVLAATINGMMLVYNGQESGFNRRLKFFEKDSIDWGKYPLSSFYQTLITLKKQNKALWNGVAGGVIQPLEVNRDSTVVAFAREKESQKILVICNLTPRLQMVKIKSTVLAGNYTNVFSKETKVFTDKVELSLKPWEYLVFEKK